MFKAPEWEDDVPNLHSSFMKKNEKVQKKTVKAKQNVTLKVAKFKGKKSLDSSIVNTNKKIIKNGVQKKPFINKTTPNNVIVKETIINKDKNMNKKATKAKLSNSFSEGNENSQTTKVINKKAKKRKLEVKTTKTENNKKKKSSDSQSFDKISEGQNFDEILLNAKKKKFNEVIENDDHEDILFYEKPKKKNKSNNVNNPVENNNLVLNEVPKIGLSKKEKLKTMLNSVTNRRSIGLANKGSQLRQRMLERLKAAQFRYLNEKLYTSSGSEAQQLFNEDPAAFETYHQGYQLQVKKWPVNPLDVIVKKILKMPKSHLIADMGCGEAALSKRVPHTVRSFDLMATAPGVEACDMSRTPLLTGSVDVTVYCLALMGTNLTQYLVEANRVLKLGGHLLIAEVESRFDNVDNFTKEVQRLGFKLKQLDKSNNVFFFIEFTKVSDPPVKKGKLPALTLKPCIYKRR